MQRNYLPGLPLGHANFNIDSIDSRPSYGYDPLTDRWAEGLVRLAALGNELLGKH